MMQWQLTRSRSPPAVRVLSDWSSGRTRGLKFEHRGGVRAWFLLRRSFFRPRSPCQGQVIQE